MIRVVLDGLVKRYDRVAVVDIDRSSPLVIQPGELTLLLGPSGAGKTTLARLVAGLESTDAGEIYFDGRVMNQVPPPARKVSLVFQDDALWPHLSVAENIVYGLRMRGIGRRERRNRVDEALANARIEGVADRRPEELSVLQRRRAALARALVVGPDLLILDEPLDGLEWRVRAEFRDEIRRVSAESQATTLILTRDPREALALADRLTVMDLGRIVQVGPPPEVYNRPVDTFVAQFLGPANLLHGQAEATDARGDVVVRTPLGRLIGQAPAGAPAGGTPVTVAIRPEALLIGPSVPAGWNRFPATLERQVFLGEARQVHLRGPGDWPVTALALQGQSHGLREGQGVTVAIAPEHVIVLPIKLATAQ